MFNLYTHENGNAIHLETYPDSDEAIRDTIMHWHEGEKKTVYWVEDRDHNVVLTICPRRFDEAVVITVGLNTVDVFSSIEYGTKCTTFTHNGVSGVYEWNS